jgi:hypothetical protein
MFAAQKLVTWLFLFVGFLYVQYAYLYRTTFGEIGLLPLHKYCVQQFALSPSSLRPDKMAVPYLKVTEQSEVK